MVVLLLVRCSGTEAVRSAVTSVRHCGHEQCQAESQTVCSAYNMISARHFHSTFVKNTVKTQQYVTLRRIVRRQSEDCFQSIRHNSNLIVRHADMLAGDRTAQYRSEGSPSGTIVVRLCCQTRCPGVLSDIIVMRRAVAQ